MLTSSRTKKNIVEKLIALLNTITGRAIICSMEVGLIYIANAYGEDTTIFYNRVISVFDTVELKNLHGFLCDNDFNFKNFKELEIFTNRIISKAKALNKEGSNEL